MSRGTLSLKRKEKSVSILDLNNAVAPVKVVSKRSNCHTLEGAMGYFKSVYQKCLVTRKKLRGNGYRKIKHRYWYVRVMPFNASLLEDGEVGKTVDILDPEGAVIEKREQMIGFDRYKVDSFQAGKDLLLALAGSDDDTFTSIMATAAEALQRVDTQGYLTSAPRQKCCITILNGNRRWVRGMKKTQLVHAVRPLPKRKQIR